MRPPEFWNTRHGRAAAPVSRTLLLPISWLYQAVSNWKFSRTTPTRLPVPVICVGNINMGGTGKTPLAIKLAQHLMGQGLHPAFLTRGYGGNQRGSVRVDPKLHSHRNVGDEPLLLAEIAPTFVGPDRLASAQMAIQAGANCLIMDDGFQNSSLAKDLSVLALDAEIGLGNGYVFPAGPLREPAGRALQRADAIVWIGPGEMAKQHTELDTFTGAVLSAKLRAEAKPPTGKLLAFAGIGRPEKFFSSLRTAGAELVQEIAFADHHAFSAKDVTNLTKWAEKYQARLITTTKDAVRWPAELRADLLVWPVALEFAKPDDVEKLLAGVIYSCT